MIHVCDHFERSLCASLGAEVTSGASGSGPGSSCYCRPPRAPWALCTPALRNPAPVSKGATLCSELLGFADALPSAWPTLRSLFTSLTPWEAFPVRLRVGEMLCSGQHLIVSHADLPHMAWKFPVSPMDCHLREDRDYYMLFSEVSPVLTDLQHLAPGWCSMKNIVQCTNIESVLESSPCDRQFWGYNNWTTPLGGTYKYKL